ncbi:MAG TPA: gamma carbonic anhydrase family protein [Methylobacterium sp.]|jgi:carbonic anhydrase/acetyltransferase-like protein (isoleucine patch superfamily)|uniref:gamma carbonic anhydrase family protein n=1 Tax=Methylorubrum sp. B1-46 TaxID=2897334 RepID=UPI001E529D05|nr:gamma carbonic anhydrase family protein [Methylorubrum sp. B1-46]UGB26318.1 gamma carbonic anhydrase family protein [Methylorubrum sp. B1-46]HEV2543118.1 gamma carbonic anhydrase family protein [Methylobacterium sp.]
MALYRLGEHAPHVADATRIWVAPGAHVIGRVRIGLDVGIWFGAVIRGDNDPIEIGDRTNIQDGAVLHADPGFPLTIGEGVTVGHGAIVHGCTIGADTLIGMGATVLNGARIGRGCIVGANALVREGAEFPDGSLIVGVPAKAVPTRDMDITAMTRMAAEQYVRNGQRFLKDLEPVDPGRL